MATYCLCILFIPILPLAAYRVRQSGGNSYQFMLVGALVPGGPAQVNVQWLIDHGYLRRCPPMPLQPYAC